MSTHRILSPIAEVNVVKPDQKPKLQVVKMNEAIERPNVLLGRTYKVKPNILDSAIYVTINDMVLNEGTDRERRYPFEIFFNTKNTEYFSWMVALTRILSALFRKGGDLTFIVEELKSLFDPRGGYWGQGKHYNSVINEIGEVIEQHFVGLGLMEPPTSLKEELAPADVEKMPKVESAGKICRECHQPSVVNMGGCDVCQSCGASKCG